MEVGTFKLPLPSTASLAYAPAHPGALPVVTSANATGPDQPDGGDAVHWYPAFMHTGSAQSIEPVAVVVDAVRAVLRAAVAVAVGDDVGHDERIERRIDDVTECGVARHARVVTARRLVRAVS